MIIKIKSRKKPSYQQLLEYILNEKSVAKDGFVITHNLRGKNMDEWIEEYRQNEKYRQIKRSDSVYLFHEILSWSNQDIQNISLEKIEDMTRKYIQLRNQNGMYVASIHTDKAHWHSHICASGIEYRTGKSLRLEKQKMRELKIYMENYQKAKYPELSKSLVHYERKKSRALPDKAYQVKLRTGRATQREQLLSILKDSYKKAKSRNEFFELLKKTGAEPYMRGGKITGVVFQKRKFRFKKLGISLEMIQELSMEISVKEAREKRQKGMERDI